MLASGRPFLAIPGPSVVPDRVLRAMHRASPNIYAGEIVEMTHALVPRLRAVTRTQGKVAIYIGNGHAAWEASLANVLREGDRVLAPVVGHFGRLWAETARAMGAEVVALPHPEGEAIDPARVEAALREDREGRIRAVLAVHADTSTGALSDLAAIREAMDAAGHGALLMVDAIASLGCDRLLMDEWGVDVVLSASQKGLMCPPGLAFLWFNERAEAARAGLARVTPYWDWRPRAEPARFSHFWCGTAPTHHVYGLSEALAMIEEEGLERVWARHDRLARAVWAACDAWGDGASLRLAVAEPARRSRAVTAVALEEADRLRAWVEAGTGVTLGIGLASAPGTFRIGHMGHVNAHMVLGALGAVEAGLGALGVPHGAGGVAAAARVVAAA